MVCNDAKFEYLQKDVKGNTPNWMQHCLALALHAWILSSTLDRFSERVVISESMSDAMFCASRRRFRKRDDSAKDMVVLVCRRGSTSGDRSGISWLIATPKRIPQFGHSGVPVAALVVTCSGPHGVLGG